MWSYYGAKTNLVNLYPPPKYGTVIEPFAGSARYALKYFDRKVILVDKYPVIINMWKWLQSCSEKDVLSLPRKINPKQTINDFKFDCEEARNLFGFLIAKAVARPQVTVSDRVSIARPNHINYSLMRIAANLFKIRDWEFITGSYEDCPDIEATHFIDPPYQFGGQSYVMSSLKINFHELAIWCKSRKGQTIVCENTKADWMDFTPMAIQRGSKHNSSEAFWTNERTSIGQVQQQLFV